ncbi:hypothetical protein LDENG_00005380 [Lucifuga dentata]|nr:hypothetical protein LDENG_00005380 [Lucifuga dentata]
MRLCASLAGNLGSFIEALSGEGQEGLEWDETWLERSGECAGGETTNKKNKRHILLRQISSPILAFSAQSCRKAYLRRRLTLVHHEFIWDQFRVWNRWNRCLWKHNDR